MRNNVTSVFLDSDSFEERLTTYFEVDDSRMTIQADIRLDRDGVVALAETLTCLAKLMQP